MWNAVYAGLSGVLDRAPPPEMPRWDILRLLCALIGASLKGDRSLSLPPAMNWQSLIEAASYRLVTPALAFALQGRSELPPAVRDYRSEEHTSNSSH